jgi:hypothetical protein
VLTAAEQAKAKCIEDRGLAPAVLSVAVSATSCALGVVGDLGKIPACTSCAVGTVMELGNNIYRAAKGLKEETCTGFWKCTYAFGKTVVGSTVDVAGS